MSKRVEVRVWNPDGTFKATLTYEAPDDAQVGDSGAVEIVSRDDRARPYGQPPRRVVYEATISSLTPSYDGPCRPFTPAPKGEAKP
jgi:hypothetical protein